MSAKSVPAARVEARAAQPCALCGASEARPVAEPAPGVVYCACACGVTWPKPLPTQEQLDAIYGEGYLELELPGHGWHLRVQPAYAEAFGQERDLTLRELGVEPAELGGRRILDVGCANGIFLNYLRERGASGVGIDISQQMVEAARARGLDARSAGLDELPADASWDVVTLWDVIEHLLDPREALQRVAGLLRAGGELWIQTPCTGLVSDAFGDGWRNYLYPQHIHLFSEPGLERLLEQEGFGVLASVRFGSGNTAGTIPEAAKRAADRVAKASGHGDTIALRARRA